MKPEFVERHSFKNWSIDLWSDGTIDVFSTHVWKKNVSHRLHLYSDLRYASLPKYVLYAIYQTRQDFRSLIRLPLEVRTTAWFWRRQGYLKVSYSRYDFCESAGEFYIPWSKQNVASS